MAGLFLYMEPANVFYQSVLPIAVSQGGTIDT